MWGKDCGSRPERHEPVQGRPQHAVELVDDAGVAQIVLARRLRACVHVQPLYPHVGAHGAEVDVLDGRRGNDLLLGEDEPERVQQLLQLRRRRRDGGPAAADPEPAVMRERLVAALVAMHVDPVHPPPAGVLSAARGGHRLAAAVLQKARQPFLQGIRALADPDHLAAVVDPDDEQAAVAVGERAQRLADPGQAACVALELGPRILPAVDTALDLMPFHGRTPCRPIVPRSTSLPLGLELR